MTRALLDVNVLLALLDADHADHARARSWFMVQAPRGWASCAITQNGFVRVISQPRYPSPVPPRQAVARLVRAARTEHHESWPCTASLLDERVFDHTRIHGPNRVTDAYLLALAVEHDGRLVTFDRSVPLRAVRTARPRHLVTL